MCEIYNGEPQSHSIGQALRYLASNIAKTYAMALHAPSALHEFQTPFRPHPLTTCYLLGQASFARGGGGHRGGSNHALSDNNWQTGCADDDIANRAVLRNIRSARSRAFALAGA